MKRQIKANSESDAREKRDTSSKPYILWDDHVLSAGALYCFSVLLNRQEPPALMVVHATGSLLHLRIMPSEVLSRVQRYQESQTDVQIP